MFTGNRGCLVDDDGQLRRHHRGSLWITCLTSYRDWRHPLDAPRVWTPLFFLDDAVALAAGHRPCGLCRRADYLAYQQAVGSSDGSEEGDGMRAPVLAGELNRRLNAERLQQPALSSQRRRRGPWLERADDRIRWTAPIESLPVGAVVVHQSIPHLVTGRALQPFSFAGWGPPIARPRQGDTSVLTPPTSVDALGAGYQPSLHPSATT
jgi:hypothetical protein